MRYFPELGIRVDSTNHISSIIPGSVAAEEEAIAVGDKIITVRIVLNDVSSIEGGVNMVKLVTDEGKILLSSKEVTMAT